jgi:hypothetical protein
VRAAAGLEAPEPRLPLRLRARAGALPLGAIFGAIGAAAAGAVGLLGLDRLPFTLCVFKAATGIPCPTCGSTRVFARLAEWDLAGAFAMNPLTTVLALGLLSWALADLVLLARGRSLVAEASPRAGTALRVAAVAAVVANWVWLVAAGR